MSVFDTKTKTVEGGNTLYSINPKVGDIVTVFTSVHREGKVVEIENNWRSWIAAGDPWWIAGDVTNDGYKNYIVQYTVTDDYTYGYLYFSVSTRKSKRDLLNEIADTFAVYERDLRETQLHNRNLMSLYAAGGISIDTYLIEVRESPKWLVGEYPMDVTDVAEHYRRSPDELEILTTEEFVTKLQNERFVG